MSDSEEYDFEYSSEEEELDDEEVLLENLYYDSKSILGEERERAIKGFHTIVETEKQPGTWSFKALKKLCKIYCLDSKTEKMTSSYEALLELAKCNAVTRAVAEKGINSILNRVFSIESAQTENSSVHAKTTGQMFEKIYKLTLDATKTIKNYRLWVKTILKLGNLYYNIGEYGKLNSVLSELRKAHEASKQGANVGSADTQSGSVTKTIIHPDIFNGSIVLEMHALQILLYTAQKDNVKLKSLYEKSLLIKGTITHPRILGVIRECGGKMYMRDKTWESARRDFFEAFKSYDEAGDRARIRCLKYLVLANMLMGSKINPFTSQEAKPYEFHPEVKAMTQLVKAFDNNQIQKFESTLKKNRNSILRDPFIRMYVEELLSTVRVKVILKTIRPYNSVRVGYLASILGIDEGTLYELVLSSILDGKLKCKIDQVNGMILLDKQSASHIRDRDVAMMQWTKELRKITVNLSKTSTNLVMTKF